MLPMRCDGGVAEAMRLTPRCINLLRLLSAARWLTTRQVHGRFFREASMDAARKRLRKLTAGEYLVMVREGRMDEALFTLGRAGKRILETARVTPGPLERKPPTQREHFLAVNDVRIAAELAASREFSSSFGRRSLRIDAGSTACRSRRSSSSRTGTRAWHRSRRRSAKR